jgi:hypothetical protein
MSARHAYVQSKQPQQLLGVGTKSFFPKKETMAKASLGHLDTQLPQTVHLPS